MTDACLKNFLMEILVISDEELIAVFPFVKKDADLNFGFKIPTSLSSFVLNPNLWCKDITVNVAQRRRNF